MAAALLGDAQRITLEEAIEEYPRASVLGTAAERIDLQCLDMLHTVARRTWRDLVVVDLPVVSAAPSPSADTPASATPPSRAPALPVPAAAATASAADVITCPLCMKNMFSSPSASSSTVQTATATLFHGTDHACCLECGQYFRNCPICRSEDITPRGIALAEYLELNPTLRTRTLAAAKPLTPPLAVDGFKCPMCATVVPLDSTLIVMHNKHACCSKCARHFRNCPICRYGGIEPKSMPVADFLALLATAPAPATGASVSCRAAPRGQASVGASLLTLIHPHETARKPSAPVLAAAAAASGPVAVGIGLACPRCGRGMFGALGPKAQYAGEQQQQQQAMLLHGDHVCCLECVRELGSDNCLLCGEKIMEATRMVGRDVVVAQLELMARNIAVAAGVVFPSGDSSSYYNNLMFVNARLFDTKYNVEYAEDERWAMIRGARPYYCPHGWRRVGINVPGFESAYASWPIAYCALDQNGLLRVLNTSLLNPGARTQFSEALRLSQKMPKSDGNHEPAVVSQSIEYAAVFSPDYYYGMRVDESPLHQFVVQVRVRPGSYAIRPISLSGHLWPPDIEFDEYFDNNELEFHVAAPEDNLVICGIMTRVTNGDKIVRIQRRIAAQTAGVTAGSFVWHWLRTPATEDYVPYHAHISQLIEFAYNHHQKPFFHIGSNQNLYFINFDWMHQVRFDNPGLFRSVLRKKI